ncbi:hypothetical protein MNBD_BACTEROID01-107 [hydrothermal vent metagenome]|uniref:LIM zinc-binding domain-containing protein n=1 Tax=hydrothermal vent metagenome TaxID=652676 RepID=A0A3B0TXL5_9ZZZZ
MGYAYVYKCQKCGYEEHFNQGYGFLVHPQSVDDYFALKKKLFHYKTHNKIVSLSKSHNNLHIKAAFQVYMCYKCKLLYNKVVIKVYDEEKTYHKSSFRCTACNRRLKLTNIHRLNRAACPKCKKKTFRRDPSHHSLWG